MLRSLLLLFVLSVVTFAASADHHLVPRWELGVALGAGRLPDYRGSLHNNYLALPFPVVRYRSPQVELDEAGARRWLYANDWMKLDVSLAGGLPVPHKSSGVRQGMPGLDPVGEIGPELELMLAKDAKHELSLHLPWRAAFSVSPREVEYQGWMFPPYLYYYGRRLWDGHWGAALAVGPQFASAGYHDYYYGVAPQYATAQRPAYQGEGGYSGSRATFYVERYWKGFWLNIYARYDRLERATFADSPLVETRGFLAGGVIFGWLFARSDEMVTRQGLPP